MGKDPQPLDELQRSLTIVVRRPAVPRVHERIIDRAGIDIDRVEAIASAGSVTSAR